MIFQYTQWPSGSRVSAMCVRLKQTCITSPIGLTVVQMMLNAGNASVFIVTALNWFGTQGSLMHLVWPPPRSRRWRGLLWSWGALPRPTVTPIPPLWRGPPPWGSAPSSSRTIPWPPLWPSTPPTSTMETMSPALRPTTYHLGTKLWRLRDTNSVSHVSQCTTFSMKSTFYYLFTFYIDLLCNIPFFSPWS